MLSSFLVFSQLSEKCPDSPQLKQRLPTFPRDDMSFFLYLRVFLSEFIFAALVFGSERDSFERLSFECFSLERLSFERVSFLEFGRRFGRKYPRVSFSKVAVSITFGLTLL